MTTSEAEAMEEDETTETPLFGNLSVASLFSGASSTEFAAMEEKKVVSVQNLTIIKLKDFPDQLLSTEKVFLDPCSTSGRASDILVKPLIEVFSVVIGGVKKDSAVCGDVMICNRGSNISLFHSEIYDSVFVPRGEPLPLLRSRVFDATEDCIVGVDLNDNIQGCNVGRGYIELGKLEREKYWDKRLCSVMKGEFGYVAVHYSLLKRAMLATVEVVLGCDVASSDEAKVYGRVVACYGAFDYPTFNDKEYYQMRLFNKIPSKYEKESEVLLCGSPTTRLFTSVVAVPEGSSLVIRGNIWASGIDDVSVVIDTEVGADERKLSTRIKGENCYADISVTWALCDSDPKPAIGTSNSDEKGIHNDLTSPMELLEDGTIFLDKSRFKPIALGMFMDKDGRDAHILGSPMVEVFRVRICRRGSDGVRNFRILGNINIVDGLAASCDIYNRGSENPETVNQNGCLSLFDFHHLGISPTGPFTISINLKDVVSGESCVSKLEYLYMTNDLYDRGLATSCGFATLFWTAIRIAVVAKVEVSLMSLGHVNSGYGEVYGSLVACYGKDFKFPSGKDGVQNFEITLFDEPCNHPASVRVGSPMTLYRSTIAVPSCSSLVIKGDLWDCVSNSRIVRGQIAEFAANHEGTFEHNFEGVIKVKVTWEYQPREFARSGDATSAANSLLEGRDITSSRVPERVMDGVGKIPRIALQDVPLGFETSTSECFRAHAGEVHRVTITQRSNGGVKEGRNVVEKQGLLLPPNFSGQFPSVPVSCGSKVDTLPGYPHIEVFSMYIGGVDNGCRVYGRVTVPQATVPLYSRAKEDAEFVLPYEPISLEYVSNFAISGNGDFDMSVALQETGSDFFISKAHLCLNSSALEKRFDERMCSILRGPKGYAAVHYTAFFDAVRANIFVRIKSSAYKKVYGFLAARHGTHDFSTYYMETYYQSRLFNRVFEEDMLDLTSGDGTIPLMKSVVAVPVDSSMVIRGYLQVISDTNERDIVTFNHEFWPQSDGILLLK